MGIETLTPSRWNCKFTWCHRYHMCHVNRDSLTHCSQYSVAQLVEQRTSSVCYQDFPRSVDFAKLRNQFSLPSEFLLFNRFWQIAKSVKFAIRISPVQLILRNCEISSVCHQNFSCSVDFAKLRNQFSFPSEFLLFSWLGEIAKLRNQLSLR